MTSVADALRARTLARVRALPVEARIRLALALGDDDIDTFARSARLRREDALVRLRQSREHGRQPSVAACR